MCVCSLLFEHVLVFLVCVQLENGVKKKYKLYSQQSFIKEDDKIKRERDRKIFVADEKRAGLKFCRVN